MSYTKTDIYNIAMTALQLSRQFSNVDAEEGNEIRTLNTFWKTALKATLADLDLDTTSTTESLQLIETLEDHPYWNYVYRYPSDYAKFRRIVSCVKTDSKATHIPKEVKQYNGEKVIFTNEYQAQAELISDEVPLDTLEPMAAMALAYKLAYLCAPLITGKGSKTLKQEIQQSYVLFKMEAQENDAAENFNYEEESIRSEFVATRLS